MNPDPENRIPENRIKAEELSFGPISQINPRTWRRASLDKDAVTTAKRAAAAAAIADATRVPPELLEAPEVPAPTSIPPPTGLSSRWGPVGYTTTSPSITTDEPKSVVDESAAAAAELAAKLYAMFSEFVDAGFTEDQAMQLLVAATGKEAK